MTFENDLAPRARGVADLRLAFLAADTELAASALTRLSALYGNAETAAPLLSRRLVHLPTPP